MAVGVGEGEAAARAFDDLGAEAEETARDQRALARHARALAARSRRGASWHELVSGQPASAAFELLARSRTRLSAVATRFRTAVAAGLAGEGATTRDIASRMGVSHQRISSMLTRNR